MNNDVKKVVFYSTRHIHPYFLENELLIRCDSLINYFSGLKKSDDKNDGFSIWLSDLAFLCEYRQRILSKGEEVHKELLNELNEATTANIHDFRTTKLPTLLNKNKTLWGEAVNEFKVLKKTQIAFEPSHIEKVFVEAPETKMEDLILTGTTTHLNGGDYFTETHKAKLKHRLGVYHKECGEYAVAAIWPWAGDKESDHDQNWIAAILKAVCELYPHNEEIVLVIHDGDLERYDKWDKIIYAQKELSEKYDELQRQLTVNPIVSFVVFQHTNESVLSPLKVDNNGKKKSPKQIWEDINKYIVLNETFRDKDKENVIANKHVAKLESYESK